MSEAFGGNGDRKEKLKEIVERLGKGEAPEAVKRDFKDIIREADAAEIADLEQSLIDGGVPVEDVQRLCEVHADVFLAGLERGVRPETMPGHPIHTYIAENREAKKLAKALRRTAWFGSREALVDAVKGLKPIIRHYERKENQLFPYLERAGFTGPSKVMWGKHDEIREAFRGFEAVASSASRGEVKSKAKDIARRISTMMFMEEKILFPNAIKRLSDADWAAIRRGDDAIGYAWVTPGAEWDPAIAGGASMYSHLEAMVGGAGPGLDARSKIPLATGELPLGVLDEILKSLPIDVSFVGADDRVMYYSDSPHRVFPRSPGVIGREVRNCHPPKSVAVVERILDSFRKKERDKAEFWIEMGGKFVWISYKPIYDWRGEYQGTLEMSMDATALRALQGQKRLLDW
jgi:hypothetical protein